ncbi:uncharacterized protein Dana_GF13898 [Drosophila ananassae]|uniref:Metalloendopeptidase n=1 Tax=Drosophila ananassae TaxID=7217 RepID=B3N1B7_DROAN|nr:seminal metalloprotease 1 [Drosophila ananassae]EDV33638.1 uncharacterized protein Dana_GF13898 [Drosophila ananassae]
MYALMVPVLWITVTGGLNYPFDDPELSPDFFQGDIIIPPLKQRNGMNTALHLWPNRTVWFEIEPNIFGDDHMVLIRKAMNTIQENSCVIFRNATEAERNFSLLITSQTKGCSTLILGFRNSTNKMNLQLFDPGRGCFRIGSLIHEFLHVLGFEHQHVAHNRDQFVRIEWENIQPEFKINFINNDKLSNFTSFGESYDYDSVMHYIPTAFSKNGKPTITPLKKVGQRMGQRVGMSEIDIRKLNKMYKCPGYV